MDDYSNILGETYNKLQILKEAKIKNEEKTYFTGVKRNQLNGKIIELESERSDLIDVNASIITHKNNKLFLKLFINKSINNLERIDKKIQEVETKISIYKSKVNEYEEEIQKLKQEHSDIVNSIITILKEIKSNPDIMYQIIMKEIEKLSDEDIYEIIFKDEQIQKIKKPEEKQY